MHYSKYQLSLIELLFAPAAVLAVCGPCSCHAGQESSPAPNIVYIMADDMGVGDVSHTTGLIATPHIDRLAREGMRFTDAHTSSSVCSPTRYALLTGRYNWRSWLKSGVIFPPAVRPMIPPERLTLPGFLQQHGYHTAVVGKWHLGLTWHKLDQTREPEHRGDYKKTGVGWDLDYSRKVEGGPTEVGFDESFFIAGSLDMAPYVYLRNDKAISTPTHVKAFHRPGASAADFEAVKCLRDFARESVDFIKRQAASGQEPFFLYLPLTSPHTPIVPSPQWQGKSPLGKYGDFVMETDWVVGEVLQALDQLQLAENTLVVFTTDNGCSPAAGIPKLVEQGHLPNGGLRGHKADIYEGGHRVPFVVRWPETVAPESVSDRTICNTDVYATIADLLGKLSEVPSDAAEDSFSFLPALLGESQQAREFTIHHSINGSFAIRQGKWKLCLCPGSGGWSAPRPGEAWKDENLEVVQLYDLESELAETENLAEQHPEIVKQLVKLTTQAITNGRTTPGPQQENDGPVPAFHEKLLEAYPEARR